MSSFDDLRRLREAFEQALRDAEIQLDAKGKTRARILRAATDCFQKDGYRRTTIDDVARLAGVAKGTVYTHFTDKADLLFFAIMEEKRRLREPFLALFKDDAIAPAERLTRYLELAFLAIAQAPLAARLLKGDHEMLLFIEEMPPERKAMVTQNQAAFVGAFLVGVGAFDRLPREEQDRRARLVTLMMMNAASLMDDRMLQGQGFSREQAARQLAKMVVAAVGSPA